MVKRDKLSGQIKPLDELLGIVANKGLFNNGKNTGRWWSVYVNRNMMSVMTVLWGFFHVVRNLGLRQTTQAIQKCPAVLSRSPPTGKNTKRGWGRHLQVCKWGWLLQNGVGWNRPGLFLSVWEKLNWECVRIDASEVYWFEPGRSTFLYVQYV